MAEVRVGRYEPDSPQQHLRKRWSWVERSLELRKVLDSHGHLPAKRHLSRDMHTSASQEAGGALEAIWQILKEPARQKTRNQLPRDRSYKRSLAIAMKLSTDRFRVCCWRCDFCNDLEDQTSHVIRAIQHMFFISMRYANHKPYSRSFSL